MPASGISLSTVAFSAQSSNTPQPVFAPENSVMKIRYTVDSETGSAYCGASPVAASAAARTKNGF